ncbi:BTB domain and ankyrin repeat protein [Aspergillus homomorphus CBS 101889]|uniref:BTB domain and ankyrin repeat protein n=1 Tax=Aspergillus homomorphus (strain CBS 101889) TaxID=1450537 RepID=A0A395I8H2_ASPHC|nr:BTB domain and ankyrin repeat protein [Aspergillus homomorphus CBS 101889]RAL16276.1 BTB domain and ankyrin repeat protein [Aspergillus homomorphus CBS 101889]
MSSKLWGFFLYDDVESFQRFLATATGTTGNGSSLKAGSPGLGLASSPGISTRSKKLSGTSPGGSSLERGPNSRPGKTLSKEELNVRDKYGRTLLHHVASSTKPTAIDFAVALLQVPFLDIYAQDWESGWTALHRALYAGNATIAQALMTRDMRDATDFSKAGNSGLPVGSLIRIKDREGYSPFDVYAATIASRDIKQSFDSAVEAEHTDNVSEPSLGDEDPDHDSRFGRSVLKPRTNLFGDEVYTFGSNKNLNLGVGDQDDRQFPERTILKRPGHLLERLFREFQEQRLEASKADVQQESIDANSNDLPAIVKSKPIKIQDVVMSKLHTAILTTDPESNLFLCGFGPGGRLGTGDETTRFTFVCIEGGGLANKKIVSVALGQDHTLAITENGEIFSWGSNKYGQLGYSLPRSNNQDDVPLQKQPRQIFNPFKKEGIIGAAASGIHSVVFSNSGLYTFGKNEGQLGLIDSDARSLEMQTTPRRVGASLFSAPIQSVSAIDQATSVLLQNHEVWVFSQYGYSKLLFPLDVSSRFIKDSFMATRYGSSVNQVVKVKSAGNTICALSSFGEVYTVQVNKTEVPSTSTSTTNPFKPRNSMSEPSRIWSVKKAHMAAKDFDVGQDGSVIICTVSGSAWSKEKRRKSKGPAKDYKFARIPGLSRVVGVCSNAYGAFAAVQRDCEVTQEQITVSQPSLWADYLPLSPFGSFGNTMSSEDMVTDDHRDSNPNLAIKRAVLGSSDLEPYFEPSRFQIFPGVVWIRTTSSDIRLPVHEFILTGRSSVLREVIHTFRDTGRASPSDIFTIEKDGEGHMELTFQSCDILTILNVAFFMYTDEILDVWHQARQSSEKASRYRQVRTEVMRLATHLNLPTLERAARLMIEPTKALRHDMELAIHDPAFFDSGDVIIDLKGGEVKAHSHVLCQRCPFFNALFFGRSGGRWLLSRRVQADATIHIDLKHIDQHVFDFVLRYLYADTEEELFDNVRSKDLDEFIDLIIDVAFVANELMIDRLAQICQQMLGKFVHTRNVCHLLNAVAPCSVKEFKDAALEYICLNLEDLLANRLLADLDESLLDALDTVCRDNQMTYLPVSRGRNSEEYIFEKYPELASAIESDKRRKIDFMRLRPHLNRIDSSEGKPRATTNEKPSLTPSVSKVKPSPAREGPLSASRSPLLKSRQSTTDLMFQMDDEFSLSPADIGKGKAAVRDAKQIATAETPLSIDSPALRASPYDGGSLGDPSFLDAQMASPLDPTLSESPSESRAAARQRKQEQFSSPPISSTQIPWSSSAISTSKKNLKDIMSETSGNRVSNISLGMSARRESTSSLAPKMSQKERKKIQQQQMQDMLAAQQKAKEAPQNPWKMPTPSKPAPPASGQDSPDAESAKPSPKPSMTLRQTVAGTPPASRTKPSSVPMQTPGRSGPVNVQNPPRPQASTSVTSTPASSNPVANAQPAIQSIRHIPRPEPYQTSFHSPSSTSLSLATILLQQQTEKDEIREAATAKHNLEDIQLEQEFQAWWDKESRRVQGLPDPDTTPSADKEEKANKSRSNRGRGKGKAQGQGQQPLPPPPQQQQQQQQLPQRKKRAKGGAGLSDASTSSQQPTPRNEFTTPAQKAPHPTPRRDNQPRTVPNGNHVDAAAGSNGGGSSRRGGGGGGRGGFRGRGKPREKTAA